MVVSNINKTVSYPPIKTIDDKDANFNATMYMAEIHDRNCLIALGKLNKSFENKGIFYIPIYLVDGDEVISKIGVFEFLKEEEATMYDADHDFNLEKFDEPLLFDFVNKEFISKHVSKLNLSTFEKDEADVDEDEDED